MVLAYLDLTSLVKHEVFEVVGDRVITAPGDELCKYIGTGVPIHLLPEQVNATVEHPILSTSVIVEDKVLVSQGNISTLVSKEHFTALLEILKIEDHVNMSGDRALVFITGNGRKILISFLKCLTHGINSWLQIGCMET